MLKGNFFKDLGTRSGQMPHFPPLTYMIIYITSAYNSKKIISFLSGMLHTFIDNM